MKYTRKKMDESGAAALLVELLHPAAVRGTERGGKRHTIGRYRRCMMSRKSHETEDPSAIRMRQLRESTGMNRKEFCEHYDIPYRTVADWECGLRHAPEYVLRMMEYYIRLDNRNRSEGGSGETAAALAAVEEEMEQGTQAAGYTERKIVSISSQRQVTIPTRFYRNLGFTDEAECLVRGQELVLRPIKRDQKRSPEEILSELIAEGFSGDELMQEFRRRNAPEQTAQENPDPAGDDSFSES